MNTHTSIPFSMERIINNPSFCLFMLSAPEISPLEPLPSIGSEKFTFKYLMPIGHSWSQSNANQALLENMIP
jgi:hypothetical protein